MTIDLDPQSGFCHGVVAAIRKAEDRLEQTGGTLYCLGDIVHNSSEVDRLRRRGLETITHEQLLSLSDTSVLLRAHGEPPSTYRLARERGIEIIDATCPVVLKLQLRIKQDYESTRCNPEPPLFLIYGKRGHAEVNGLVGQTEGSAIVVESPDELAGIDLDRDVYLYSQTTKSIDGFQALVAAVKERKSKGQFIYHDTICRQVARRREGLRKFASEHDVVIFVSGAKSSNGAVLFADCLGVNPRSHRVSSPEQIDLSWLEGAETVGICGATSTPGWLMAQIKQHIEDNTESGV